MKKKIEVKVEKELWESAKEDAFKKLNAKAKIAGFRPGKAPKDVYIKNYGIENILYEAADQVINKKYNEIVMENKVIPAMDPIIDIVKLDEEGLEVNYTLVAITEIKLGKYKNLGIKEPAVKVTKKEIEHELEHVLEHYAELISKEGEVENGNVAIIDFEGFKDGVAFEGGSANNYQLEIGSHSFIEGFEDGIIGMKKGETKELNLKFPEDYMSEDLKGSEVVFKVTVNEIKERKLPELNEEFFEDLAMPGVASKEDLEKELENEIREHKKHHAKEEYTEKVLEEASKNMTIDIEDEMINHEKEHMYEHMLERITSQGLTEELYLTYTGKTKEDILKDMEKEAKKNILYRNLLNEVIKEEKITVSDKEVDDRLIEMQAMYNMPKEDILKELGSLETLKYDIMINKALEIMSSNK